MDLSIIRLLFDAGLFVLIWLVQLVVYPSFIYYDKQKLVIWHKQYAFGLSVIVIPLMLGQLLVATSQLLKFPTSETIIGFILVILVWIATFALFVPIHNEISKHRATDGLLKKLVSRNWLRTFLWTFIFGLSILNYLN